VRLSLFLVSSHVCDVSFLSFHFVSLSCVCDDVFWFCFCCACTVLFLRLGVVSDVLHVCVLVMLLGGRPLLGQGGRVGTPLLSVRLLFLF